MAASATGSAPLAASPGLPVEFVDAHHHFLDTKKNDFSKKFLGSLLQGFAYLPEDYKHQVVEPLQTAGVKLVGSVHVEGMPDDGAKEAAWISSFQESESTVAAIVASCDLTDPDVDTKLHQLKQDYPKVKGVRWILDCVGPFDPIKNPATHVATLRHDGIDYLRGSNGGYNGETVPEFERGFALLGKYGFSFDLQCAPVQLDAAAALFARHPNIPVCIDHLGKPRALLLRSEEKDASTSKHTEFDEKEMDQWRHGMKAMARLPHVRVKISMLGYAVPGWTASPERTALVKQLVLETVKLFGTSRCMVALNWWKDAATSDTDGRSDVGPEPVQFLEYMSTFFADLSNVERQMLFVGTARSHYRF
jgi:predicted TIM-barrel fold metal-dependent hydrolase